MKKSFSFRNFTIFFFLGLINIQFTTAIMPGGISDDEKPATPELNTMLLPILPGIHSQISELSNEPCVEMCGPADVKIISYKSQVVAGTNYFIKIKVGNNYYHVRVFRDLKGNLQIVRVVGPKTESDPILYF